MQPQTEQKPARSAVGEGGRASSQPSASPPAIQIPLPASTPSTSPSLDSGVRRSPTAADSVSPFPYTVTTHTLRASHVRDYPNALLCQNHAAALQLSVKQYTPVTFANPPSAESTPITILAAHANGVPKEAYEPLWQDLHTLLSCPSGQDQTKPACHIANIFIADVVNQGASHALNASILGDDTGWFDHSRDMLHMVNMLSHLMSECVVGIAHSMGCAQMVQLATMHPRLMRGLVLMEPAIMAGHPRGANAARGSSGRRDTWGSRAEAANELRRTRLFAGWNERCWERFVRFGLRDVSSSSSSSTGNDVPVTLTTPKHQEAWTYLRSNFTPVRPRGSNGINKEDDISIDTERLLSPDTPHPQTLQFYRPEPPLALLALPFLRPSTLYLWAQSANIIPSFNSSTTTTTTTQQDLITTTGTGPSGSGGIPEGRVTSHTIHYPPTSSSTTTTTTTTTTTSKSNRGASKQQSKRTTHMAPLEAPFPTAALIAPFLARECERLRREKRFWASFDADENENEKEGRGRSERVVMVMGSGNDGGHDDGDGKNGRVKLSRAWMEAVKRDPLLAERERARAKL